MGPPRRVQQLRGAELVVAVRVGGAVVDLVQAEEPRGLLLAEGEDVMLGPLSDSNVPQVFVSARLGRLPELRDRGVQVDEEVAAQICQQGCSGSA